MSTPVGRSADCDVLGWLATAVFLEINGVAVTRVSNDAVYDLVIAVAAGGADVDDIAASLRAL